MSVEIWKPVKGYEGLYEVSNFGRVKSLERVHTMPNGAVIKHHEKILVAFDDGKGYMRLHLSKNGKLKSLRIHRLIAEAFIPNPDNFPIINHIDGNKKNNDIENLEWCTQLENVEHAYKNGLSNRNVPRPVKSIDIYGNVQLFTSQCDASRKTGVSQQNISACCIGKMKNAGGYIWQFKE